MDHVFAQLALSTATLVGKAAFGAAGSMAVRHLQAYVTDKKTLDVRTELVRLQRDLELRLDIVSPIIDLIELVASHGQSHLKAAQVLAVDLRQAVNELIELLGSSDDSVDALSTAIASTSLHPSDKKSHRRISGVKVEEGLEEKVTRAVRDVLSKLDAAIPYLQLSLTAAGISFSTSLPNYVSPSKLLKASNVLALAQHAVQGSTVTVASVPVRIYSLFIGSARKSNIQWTWRELYPKAILLLELKQKDSSFSYEMTMLQDLEDGRYHEDGTKPECKRFAIHAIGKMYFSNSGRLLMIEEANSAALVLKILKMSTISRKDDPRKPEPHVHDFDWYALELFTEDGDESDGNVGEISLPTPATPDVDLKVVEYLLRLMVLEEHEQTRLELIDDDKISLALMSNAEKADADVLDSPKGQERSESPLARRSRK
jgi:hypothetical protein